MSAPQRLTPQKQLFAEAYSGDEIEACRIAGYEGNRDRLYAKGQELLRDPSIIAFINDREKYRTKTETTIATREERQKLWTDIMRNKDPHYRPGVNASGVSEPEPNIPLPIRLKASETLGKSEADFMDRINVTNDETLNDIILLAHKVPKHEIEAIEAEYTMVPFKGSVPMPEPLPSPSELEITVEDLI